jgi:hypothetical protein
MCGERVINLVAFVATNEMTAVMLLLGWEGTNRALLVASYYSLMMGPLQITIVGSMIIIERQYHGRIEGM